MKNKTSLLFLLCGLIALLSCGSEKDNASTLLGKWDATKWESNYELDGDLLAEIKKTALSSHLDFREDKSFILSYNTFGGYDQMKSDTGTWDLTGENHDSLILSFGGTSSALIMHLPILDKSKLVTHHEPYVGTHETTSYARHKSEE